MFQSPPTRYDRFYIFLPEVPPSSLAKNLGQETRRPGAMAGCMGPKLPEAGVCRGAGFQKGGSINPPINVGKIDVKMLKDVENMEKIWTDVETYGKNMERCGNIWKKYGKMLKHMEKSRQITMRCR